MTHFFSDLRSRMHKRAAYRETLAELRALPLQSRIDIDVAGREDAVARKAVYG